MTEDEIQLKSAKLHEVLRVARSLGDWELEQSAQRALLALRTSTVKSGRHDEFTWQQQFVA